MNQDLAMAGELQRRFYGAPSKPTVDTKARTCELSFSSTAPVARPFGVEVLSHAPGAADLSRLNNSANVLFNHDENDILGVVERAFIDTASGKGRAVIRFGKDARGEWAMQQAADGVLVNVSFAYIVDDYTEAPDGTLIAEAWEALEISLVTVPADQSVGIGRSITFKGNRTMDETLTPEQRLSRTQRAQQTQQTLLEQSRMASENERARVLEIAAMGRRYNVPERQILEMQQAGTSIDDARARVLEHVQSRQASQQPVGGFSDDAGIGMSDQETQSFSLVRAINAAVNNDWSRAGLERAASRAMESRHGRSTQGFYVPTEVLKRGQWGQRAAYNTGGANTGQSLVATDLMVDQFIEVLRNSAMVAQAGATVLSGLVGDVDIPRQISQTPTYWVAESAAVTEGEATFDKLSLRPKTIGALSLMSRMMLMQSTPAIEALVRSDLIASLGLGLDLAALSGTGASSQPQGIANTSGISAVILGTNGANVTLDTLIALETGLNTANAPMPGRAYMINAKTAATLKNLKSSTGQYLWTDSPPGQRSGTPRMFNGYPVFVTNQARSNLTKNTSVGVCSELFFGSWPDLVIAQWGVLEVLPSMFDSTGFKSGDVWIRALQTCDIGVRRPASFSVCSDALTP